MLGYCMKRPKKDSGFADFAIDTCKASFMAMEEADKGHCRMYVY